MIDAPISDDLEYDSDYLDEYHGREAFMEGFEGFGEEGHGI